MEKKGWVVAVLCSVCAVGTAVMLLLLALTGMVILYVSSNGSGSESITITGLSSSEVDPFTVLTVEGSGFDPEGSAVSVSFAGADGFPVTVPASYAGDDKVEVVVPPMTILPNQTYVATEVRVIMVRGSSVLTSNTLKDLNVQPLDDPGTRTRTGFYALQFISFNSECIARMIQNESDPSKISGLLSYQASLTTLGMQIGSVYSGEAGSMNLTSTDGGLIELDRSILDELDVFVYNIVTRSIDELDEDGDRSMLTRAGAVDEEYERRVSSDIERIREYAQTQHDVGAMLLEPAAKFVYGMYTTMTGIVGCAAQTMSLAAQVALAVGSSWLTQMASGEVPTPSGTLQTAMETIADDRMGAPVIGLVKELLTLFSKFNEGLEEARKFRPGEPSGGVIVTDERRTPDEDARVLYKSGPGATVRTLMLPGGQIDKRIEDLYPQVPPGHVAYSGTFDGGATFPRTTYCPYDGNVVSHFEYDVVITGTLEGEVDGDGKFRGTLEFQGEWSATGTPGCPHIACVPSGGPISLTQSVSGRTSGFSARGSGMVGDVSGSMDPDVVTGHLSFQTTDGPFTVQYTLTPE